jgi:acyl-CoA synthetase (AMP-forming)/AMP-acid ligase II
MADTWSESLGGVVEALGNAGTVGADVLDGLGQQAAGAMQPATEAAGGVASAAAGVASKVPVAGGPASSALRYGGQAVQAAQVLVETGIARPLRPDQAVEAAQRLLDYKLTPAAGFTIGALRYPDQPAIVDEIGVLTYGEVDRRTNALARGLAAGGVGEGDGVAIMCRDHRGFIEATVALSKLGATALYYNTYFAGPQLKDVTEREDPKGIVYDIEFADVLEDALEGREGWVAWSASDDDDDAEPRHQTLEQLIADNDDADVEAPDGIGKIVLLTSGSTGTPKGAPRSTPSPMEPIIAIFGRIPFRARTPTMFAAPMFHAFGFMNLQLGLLLSSTYVLRRRFDPEGTLAAIADSRARQLVIVPIMLQRILELDEDTRGKYDVSSLEVVASSGGALTGETAEQWMDAFGDNLYNFYGSTEVAYAAIATPQDLRAAPGTSGKAPPGTSLKILDDDRNEVDAGKEGQIFVGNEMLLEGYTGDDERDEVVDGHMATGDLGYLDEDGRLFVQGRADDMIVSGGENVYPEEVEETLAGHDAVAEAAVIGVDDEEFGERLKAFVVKDGDVGEDDLKKHVKDKLASFKVPRDIEFVDELPRKPQGKVDKKKLEEQQEEDAGDGDGES